MRLVIALLSIVVAFGRTPGVDAQQPEPPPNAADAYAKAEEWWKANAKGDAPIFTEEEYWSLFDPYDAYGPNAAVQRAAYERAAPYIELARAAGRTRSIDRQLDFGEGFGLLLPHLSDMRNATRVLRLDAQVRLDRGDAAGALESLRAISGIGAHSKADRILVSSLVSASVLMVQDGVLDEALGRGEIDAAAAGMLLEDLSMFEGGDPINVVAALDNERVMARASVEQSIGKPEGIAELLSLVGSVSNKAHEDLAQEFVDLDTDGVRAELDRYDAVMGEYSAAMQNPDREAARAAIDAIGAKIEKGEAGLVAMVLAPAVGRIADAHWRMQDLVAERTAMLKALRDGTALPSAYMNAAFAYLRLAALVRDLPEDSQRDIEAFRVAGEALDADSVERVRRLIGPFRETLVRDFRLAGLCKRCEFPMATLDRGVFAQRYLPPLRAALRVALADALAGPSPRGADPRVRGSDVAPAPVAEAACFGIRLAADLARDPSIAHALVASTVLAESAAALRDGAPTHPLSHEEVTALTASLATIKIADPVGLRAAVGRDSARVVEAYRGRRTGGDPAGTWPETQQLEQRGLAWLAGLLLARQMLTTEPPAQVMLEPQRLAMPLQGLADIIDVTTLESIRTQGLAVLGPPPDPVPADYNPMKRQLGFMLEKPPVDSTAAEARAAAALASIGELTRAGAER